MNERFIVVLSVAGLALGVTTLLAPLDGMAQQRANETAPPRIGLRRKRRGESPTFKGSGRAATGGACRCNGPRRSARAAC